MSRKTALIIGAGPAGLTAAYELLKRTDVTPIVLEMSAYMGGLSRTVRHRGNRIDIGGSQTYLQVGGVNIETLRLARGELLRLGEVPLRGRGRCTDREECEENRDVFQLGS